MSLSLRLPRWLRRRIAAQLARPVKVASPRRRRACLFKVDRIGDFVLATGALRLLIERYGMENCRLLVSTPVEPIARLIFPGLALSSLPASANGIWRELTPLRRKFAAAIHHEEYDDLICLRHQASTYRDVVLAWIPANQAIGLDLPECDAAIAGDNHPINPVHYPKAATPPWSRELLAHADVVEKVIGRRPTWAEIRPTLSQISAIAGDTLVICPFGGDRIRDYPREAWRAMWRMVDPSQLPAQLLLLGPAERHDELVQLGADWREIHPEIRLEIRAAVQADVFLELIAGAKAVLTVESAAAHVATALGKPATILVGGGHHGWFAPWGTDSAQRWVSHPLPCFGCNWRCQRPTVECLAQLPPETVAHSLVRTLAHA